MTASIRASNSAAYYLQRDHTLYYLTGELGLGSWHGVGGVALGFSGTVSPEALQAAYDGFSPKGRELVQHQADKNRQPAWDITLSCPKFLSVLWSVLDIAGRHRIEAVVLEAAKRTVDYLDSHALYTRRGKYGATVEKANGVYTLIPHGMSRALDPQLHIHVLCLNLCLRKDGTTGTIRSKDLYLHKMAAGAVFHLELAYLLLHELGIVTVPDDDNPWTFKIPGVPQELCDEQSKRREAIITLAKEAGWESPEVMARLAIATRKAKSSIDLGDCFEQWQATAKEFGLTPEAATKILDNGKLLTQTLPQLIVPLEDRQAFLHQAIDKAVERVAANEAHFPETKILQEVSTLLHGQGFSASEVIGAVDDRMAAHYPEIFLPTRAELRHFSTKANLAAEKELIERVTRGKDAENHLITPATVERAIKKEEQLLSKALGTTAKLTTDQINSLQHITRQPGDTKLIQGVAGAGKTQMLGAAYRAWTESGLHVLGCTMTGRAAQGLQKATQIPSVTIAGLLHELRPELSRHELRRTFGEKLKSAIRTERHEAVRAGEWLRNPLNQMFREIGWAIKTAFSPQEYKPEIKLTNKSILVIDEAATLPTKAWLAIKQECDKAGAKIVAVGDRLQLPPIEAGAPFWTLAKISGCEALNTIVRQKYGWMKQAIEHVIADRPLEALQLYAKNDSLVVAKHKTAAVEKLVERYSQAAPHELAQIAALTGTNRDAQAINQAMQQKRKAAKELGFKSTKLPNGERVHVGDVVALRHNDYQIDVRNGIRGTIIGIERPQGLRAPSVLKINLHGEKEAGLFSWRPKVIRIDLTKYRDVQLGYALTTHIAQGMTLKESHVLMSESLQSKNMVYTQLTRHTDRCTIYATEAEYGDSMEVIAKQMSRSIEKDMAVNYRTKLEEVQRQQEQTARHQTEAQRQQEQQIQLQLNHDQSLSL